MKPILVGVAVVAMLAPSAAIACASCGCTLTSDWLSQGLVTQPGTVVALRYDFLPQTVLRSERKKVDRNSILLPPDREIERYTYNHYATLSVDRQFASDWGVNLQVPLIHRAHATITEGESDSSYSHTDGIGDVRISARWQGLSTPGSITGLQFGAILPTGRVHQRFRSGPEAGAEFDRGLQAGTGSTQLLIGAYHYGRLVADLDFVVQAQGQIPVTRRDRFSPGVTGDFSAGVQYGHWRGVTPQLQLNLRVNAKDRGANADRPNSGGELLNLAPGISVRVGRRVSAFGFAQLPLYQRVNGFQLAPRVSFSTGLQVRL